MFTALFLVVVVVVMAAAIVYFSMRKRLNEGEIRARISDADRRLFIAEKKFMQGKIKRGVFDSISSEIEEDLMSCELALLRHEKAPQISVASRAERVVSLLSNPTPHRRAKINSILKETSLIRHEMSHLEAKLLKRAIRESVFEKMIAKKEAKLIEKEKELGDIVASSEKSP